MKKPDVLRKQEDFTKLYKKGKSSGSRHLVLLYRENDDAAYYCDTDYAGSSDREDNARGDSAFLFIGIGNFGVVLDTCGAV